MEEYSNSARGSSWMVFASPPKPEPQMTATRGCCRVSGRRSFKNEKASTASSYRDLFFGASGNILCLGLD